MVRRAEHDPEKWAPVFRKIMLKSKEIERMTIRRSVIML